MSRSLIAPIALACTLLCATQARADNVSFAGFANGYQTVTVALSSPNLPLTQTVQAGGFMTSLNGGPSFATFCIDLYQHLDFSSTFNDYHVVAGASHSFANANANTDISRLYAEGNALTSATAEAAFQIAIWEIAFETSGSYSLGAGSARFSGGTAATSGALALASSWLSALPATSNYTVTTLESASHQDQVFATPAVPEPSTYALMFGGLVGMGLFARRRSAPRD